MVDFSQDNHVMGASAGQGSADNPAYTVEQALYNLQQTDDPSARYYAAWWIGRFRVNDPVAIDALLIALKDKAIALLVGVIRYEGMRRRLWENWVSVVWCLH